MYPNIRLRRNRKSPWIRDLLAENFLLPQNLILPIFVIEGQNKKVAIKLMPDIYQQTIDQVISTAAYAQKLGIKAIALFPVTDVELKDNLASEAFNQENLICRTIRAIKATDIDIGIICDVALDPYTIHGHDGIVIKDQIHNDTTLNALSKQALTLAKAGADVIAPSDMMDGRVGTLRRALDNEGFENVTILSYAAKYASSFYYPFRDALNNNKKIPLDKSTYQMDIRNISEAMKEIEHDIAEGADIIMVKPGLSYLDVIYAAHKEFNIPIFAYQVSGEYAMLKFASQAGALNWHQILLETLISFKRAGATAILTYGAIEVAEILQNLKTK